MIFQDLRFRSNAARVILLGLLSTLTICPAYSQKFKVVHAFKGPDGSGPASQPLLDTAGNLYGTTIVGGSGNCSNGGCGTAFKMDKTGKLVWSHSFTGPDGNEPFPGLSLDTQGNFLGATLYGGKNLRTCGGDGCGVAFKLDMRGNETVLHKFDALDWPPVGPLVEDSIGNLYGATQYGSKDGTVFEISPAGKQSILHNFGCASKGCDPAAGVILDSDGNIYGTTFLGGDLNCNPGQGCGVVFQIDSGGNETILHTFHGPDGANPGSGLLFDTAGNLYGTTDDGGNMSCDSGSGCGVVFELSPQSDGTWTEKVLYSFCSLAGCADGAAPAEGPLIQDVAGNLYGTTELGGTSTCNGSGCGVAFKLDESGKETVLHSFTGGTDGEYPITGLTLDSAGTLYGTAPSGGAHGHGVIFKITQ